MARIRSHFKQQMLVSEKQDSGAGFGGARVLWSPNACGAGVYVEPVCMWSVEPGFKICRRKVLHGVGYI